MNPYFGFFPSIPVIYLHECPYCHVIHENTVETGVWCEEHAEKKALWDKRGSNMAKWSMEWACPGCPQCEQEIDS